MTSDDLTQAELNRQLQKLAIRYKAPQETQNRSLAAMEAIKVLILKEELGPGDPLPTEPELMEQLGVSRSSVREAVRKLEALDIVEVRHGSGTFVGELSLSPMMETMVLKASMEASGGAEFLLEVAGARLAFDLGLATTVVNHYEGNPDPELDQIVTEMTERAATGQGFMTEDIRFHDRLLRALDNELVRQTYSALWMIHSAIVPDLVTDASGKAVPTVAAHRAMLDAAYAGDVEAYREAVCQHYVPLRESLEALVEEGRGRQKG